MALSSKKQTTQSTQTTTPNNPAWVTSALQGYTDRVNQIGQNDASQYVTGPTATQTQAYNSAQTLGNNTGGIFSQAQKILSGLSDAYENPYTEGVINSAMADYDQQAGQLKASNAAAAAKNNAFGGSRYALTEALTNSQLNQDRSSLYSGLLSDAYDKSINNKLNTANALTGLGTAQGSDERANISTQLSAGADERAINQEQATADITLAQILGALYGQGQYGLLQGQTSTGNSTTTSSNSGMDVLGSLLQAGATAAGGGATGGLAKLFSDTRLKRDIEPAGLRNGRKWYRFRYLWSDQVHEGVMAQENPDIAMEGPGGFLMVDYGRL